eukprot:SAG31_NODE_14726_length_790_cov_1.234443_1_plen_83_part_01
MAGRLLWEFDLRTNGLVNVTACDPVSGAYQGFMAPSPAPAPQAVPLWQVRAVAFSVFVPTIRQIRDFYHEMERTNRESVTLYQ